MFSVTFFEVACLSSFSEDISSKVKVPHKNDKRGYYGSGDHRICIVSVYLLRWWDISRYSRQVWEWGGDVGTYYIKLLLRAEMLLKINICRISSFKARSYMARYFSHHSNSIYYLPLIGTQSHN